MNDVPSFLIADDHPLFRQALIQILQETHPSCEIFQAGNFSELLEILYLHPAIDVLLLDLAMPGNHGIDSVKSLIIDRPEIAILVISANNDLNIIQQLLDLGVNGFVPKSSSFETIAEAIQAVLDMKTWLPDSLAKQLNLNHSTSKATPFEQLTPQQIKVLAMIADGKLNKQIAFELGIQETTIKQHVSAILKKLNVINRTQAGILYKQQLFD